MHALFSDVFFSREEERERERNALEIPERLDCFLRENLFLTHFKREIDESFPETRVNVVALFDVSFPFFRSWGRQRTASEASRGFAQRTSGPIASESFITRDSITASILVAPHTPLVCITYVFN